MLTVFPICMLFGFFSVSFLVLWCQLEGGILESCSLPLQDTAYRGSTTELNLSVLDAKVWVTGVTGPLCRLSDADSAAQQEENPVLW